MQSSPGTRRTFPYLRSRPSRTPRWRVGTVAAITLAAVLCSLVLYPIVTIVVELFFRHGRLTLDVFSTTFSGTPGLRTVARNTLILTVSASALAICIGALLAWLAERTDATLPGTGFLPLIPFLMPAVAGSIGWVILLSPRAGFANVAIRSALHLRGPDGPFNIFTFPGLILVTTTYLIPYAYLLIGAALRNADASLEEASRISGAGALKTAVRITLPLVAPAVAASSLLVVVTSIIMFSVPIIIGTPAGIDVITAKIYRLVAVTYPPKLDAALVLGSFLLAIIPVSIVLSRLVSTNKRYELGNTKGYRTMRISLGVWRWPARALVAAYMAMAVLGPLVAIVTVSLEHFWSPHPLETGLTLINFRRTLSPGSETYAAIKNSFILAGLSGSLSCIVGGAFISRMLARSSRTLRSTVDGVLTFPLSIPHSVLGIGLLVAFSREPLVLYGSTRVLVIAYIIIFIPYAMNAVGAAASQVSSDLEAASSVSGASELRTFSRISLPLMAQGLIAGWLLLFVLMCSEVTASSLLSTPGTPVAGARLLQIYNNGTYPQVTALAVVTTVLTATVVLVVQKLTSRIGPARNI